MQKEPSAGGVSPIQELRKRLILSNLQCLPIGWAPEVQSRLKNTIYRKAERLFFQQIPYWESKRPESGYSVSSQGHDDCPAGRAVGI